MDSDTAKRIINAEAKRSATALCFDSPADGILLSHPFSPVTISLYPQNDVQATHTTSRDNSGTLYSSIDTPQRPSYFSSSGQTTLSLTMPSLLGTLRRETLSPTPVPRGQHLTHLPPYPQLSSRWPNNWDTLNRSTSLSPLHQHQQLSALTMSGARASTPPFISYMKRKRAEEHAATTAALNLTDAMLSSSKSNNLCSAGNVQIDCVGLVSIGNEYGGRLYCSTSPCEKECNSNSDDSFSETAAVRSISVSSSNGCDVEWLSDTGEEDANACYDDSRCRGAEPDFDACAI
eukprot:Lankesteria_metandrocarpae@DN7381_c0_g1_i1.p1